MPTHQQRVVIMSPKALWNFAEDQSLVGRRGGTFTYTRTGTMWDLDDDGILQSVAADTPFFNSKGISIWRAATNNCLHNQDATNAAWTKTNITAAKDAVGLDGNANSASSLVATAANGTCTQAITLASGARRFNVYIKRKTGTGTIEITIDGGSTWVDITSSINSSTFTRVATGQTITNPTVGFRIVTDTDAIEFDVAQLETTIDTPPILTTSSTVTRSLATCRNSSITGWFDDTQGTLYARGQFPEQTIGGSGIYVHISQGGAGFGPILYNSNGTPVSLYRDGTTNEMLKTHGTEVYGDNTVFEHIMAWEANNGHAAFNGSLSGSADTVLTVEAGGTADRIDISASGFGAAMDGYLAEVKYWNVRNPNGFLTSETA